MKKTISLFVFVIACTVLSSSISAQSSAIWTDVAESSFQQRGQRVIAPSEYRLVKTDIRSLQDKLSTTLMERTNDAAAQPVYIDMPMPNGENWTFEMVESPIFQSGFTERFPEIRTYAGVVVDRPGVYGRFDMTPQGFHGMVMIAGQSTVFIDPFTFGGGDIEHYMSYEKRNFTSNEPFSCGVNTASPTPSDFEAPQVRTPYASCERREYRLAISATGEYTDFHGGTVADAAAAQVTTMNRVNGVYERDLAIRMIIIANNSDIIYTDAGSDPFTDGSAGTMINQNQTNTDAVIGSANYDIGHIFSIGGSGLAGLGVVCTGSKARGVTGRAQPVGDPYDIDYVAHEMGHQFSGNHTQNNSCNRNGSTAMEPGSASTIMGYAGICAPDVQPNSDDHFHGVNLREMGLFISGTGNTCAVQVPLSNNSPVINSFSNNLTIPSGTPFALTVDVTDADATDVLTYCWEQMDNAVASMPPSANSGSGPAFRSNSPNTSPTRHMPNLADQLAGVSPTWEVLSNVTRDYNFRITVRDNAPGGSCTQFEDSDISVDGNSGPFITLNPSASGIVWNASSAQTVTWNVAGTDVAPVSCANVDITLSIDGGLTFPYTLASSTSNDGTENINVPSVVTGTARVRIECSDNIFYDISDNNFTISNAVESPCQGGFAGVYPCSNYDLVNLFDMTDLGQAGGVEANDIWGWTDPIDGKEYAILGLTNGTAFIDISDPANPVLLGNLPTHTTTSLWRDVKVYNNHAFIVSEAGGHGMQIFDLTQLGSVVSPPVTFSNTAHYAGFGSAHNIVINEATGFAYAVGASTFAGGLDFINITDPVNPTDAGGFEDDGYTHDAQVVIYTGPDAAHTGKEIAFASNADTFTIVDVDDKSNPAQLSRTTYVGEGYTHQGWVTEDHQYYIMNDELDEQQNSTNTRTFIWDIQDLDAPVLIDFYEHPSAAIDHNLYIKGDTAYLANYRAGLRVMDITDVANGNMTEVGFFDVYPANDAAQFNGAWSNYPYFESGNIIVSSIEDGLFILAPSPEVACSDPVGLAANNPTDVGADLSWLETGQATLWDIEIVLGGASASGNPTVEDLDAASYTYSNGTAGTAYDFYVRADCDGVVGTDESFWSGPFSFTTLNAPIPAPEGVTCASSGATPYYILVEDFETGAAGWTGNITSSNLEGSWEIPNESGSAGTGPSSAHSGSTYTNYEASSYTLASAELISPAIDLTTVVDDAELSFYMHAFGASMGTLEVGVGASPSGPFTALFNWSGQLQTSAGQAWQAVGLDLSSYVGQTIHVRFQHTGIGDFEGDMSLDLIRVETCAPAGFCAQPLDLLSDVGSTNVELSWTENGVASLWDVEVVAQGATPTGTPTASGLTAASYLYNIVTFNSSFDFYVRADCDPDAPSSWSGPNTFITGPDFCGDDQFVDPGGVTGDYGNSQVQVTTICPDTEGGSVEAAFIEFEVEEINNSTNCYDVLNIYNGADVNSTPITPADLGIGTNTTGGFCYDPISGFGSGDLNGVTVASSDPSGCLTFEFFTDGSVVEAGWIANISCTDNTPFCPGDFNLDGFVNINDFLMLNTIYGQPCTDCLEDMNSDGFVNINDFLALNSVYGTDCSTLFDGGSNQLKNDQGSLIEVARSMDIDPTLANDLKSLTPDNGLTIFPNPTEDQSVTVRFNVTNSDSHVLIRILDLTGRVHQFVDFKTIDEVTERRINFDHQLTSGLYIMELTTGDRRLKKTFVVK